MITRVAFDMRLSDATMSRLALPRNDPVQREFLHEQISKLITTGSIEIHSSLLNVVLRDQPQIKR
jgi:hypothetical protein